MKPACHPVTPVTEFGGLSRHNYHKIREIARRARRWQPWGIPVTKLAKIGRNRTLMKHNKCEPKIFDFKN